MHAEAYETACFICYGFFNTSKEHLDFLQQVAGMLTFSTDSPLKDLSSFRNLLILQAQQKMSSQGTKIQLAPISIPFHGTISYYQTKDGKFHEMTLEMS